MIIINIQQTQNDIENWSQNGQSICCSAKD